MLFKKPPSLFALTLVVLSGILFGFRDNPTEPDANFRSHPDFLLAPETDLIITGVMDGPLSGGLPKIIELYAVNDIADLSVYAIGSANNGGGTDGPEAVLSGSLSQGGFFYIATDTISPVTFFGPISPLITTNAAAINGDDAIELFYDASGIFAGSESVIDVFGDINVDGSGQPWEHLDGWAYRVNETGPDGSTFVLANWSFSGPNALDGETSNATAAKPFPIGTYKPASTGSEFDLQITEIWPGQAGSDLTNDWFEIYNAGTGSWVSGSDPALYYDDESADANTADEILGLSEIPAGSSVIVVLGDAGSAASFVNVWSPDYDLSGIEVGYTDGAGLGGGGDAVNIWVGDPTASSPVDTEGYPDTGANDGQSYDVVNAAFSIDGQGSAAPGTNEANSTTLLGGTSGTVPAVGSPGNQGPLQASLELQITEIWPGQNGTDVTEDWFEIYNSGVIAWEAGVDPDLFYDDESADPAAADMIVGITDIQPGESVIVVVGGLADASAFSTVWAPDYNLTGIEIGYSDGAGLGQGGDAVNIWVGTPTVSNTPIATGSYPDAATNSGQSYDLVNGAFSTDGGGAPGAGTHTAAATTVLGGVNGDEPAIGSPGNNGPILGAFDLQITEMWPGQAGSDLTADWFEIYNAGPQSWVSGSDPDLYYDDESADPGDAVIISGITDIQVGESVIIVIGDQADANTFSSVWAPDYDLTGIEIGFTDGAGLGGGADAVNIWAGLPSVNNTPLDTEAYSSADTNDGQSFDVVNAAYSTDGGGATAPGTNVAVATTALGGSTGVVPAIGSPGNQGPLVSTVGDPTIIVDVANLTPFLRLPKETTGSVSGTINDPTDPASTIGIPFDVEDVETAVSNLVVKAVSDNAGVVPDGNLALTGTDGDRLLTISPVGVGIANITVTVQDADNNTDTYIIQYAASAASVNPSTSRFHTAASDASTAIPIDPDYMWVGDDEDQSIRLYDRNESGLPLTEIDFNADLGSTAEIDIEGSFKNGNTIFWMGSHESVSRAVLFTTVESGTGANATLSYGDKYTSLRNDLLAWDNGNSHGLGTDFFGLNTGFELEALSLEPGSSTTAYLGFRAPLVSGEALIVPVTNFTALPGAGSGSATFGTPITLDLEGRSLRSMECNANGCILIGGPVGTTGDFKLFTWTGNGADAPEPRAADLTALQTAGSFETIVELPAGQFLGNAGDNLQIPLLVDNGTTDYYNTAQEAKDLRDEWKKFRSELVSLGAVEGVVVATDPLINEFVFNHTGSDTEAFIEVFGDASTDYSAFTLIEIEGDFSGTATGTIDAVLPLGTTNAGGYFTDDEDVENGTVTLLLVSNFTGSAGTDLDTDDDGVLDSTPWDAIVDAVGVNDGGSSDLNYGGATVLLAGFDGGSFTVGGASRIPNGTDTDAISDWTRNDFDLAGIPGFAGSPDPGEALNTPGAENELVPVGPTDPLINEFVFNHTGSDTEAFIEVFGDASTDYSAFSLIEIEGDFSGTATGTIDAVLPLGTTNAGGYFTDDEDVENGTVTLLLVSNFTGSAGTDLDTDDDGVLDSTPWDAIVDAVGVNDGGSSDLNYGGATVLLAGFDGGTFTVGGASRIPNGTDTDAISDWTRNDFDLAGIPGFAGSPDPGEALNTPGAENELVSDVDNAPPVVVTLTPPNGGTDVDVATNLIAEFNEDIQAGTGTVQLFDLTDILVESFDIASLSIVGNTLTINPTLDLDPGQTYYVTIDAGAIQDLAGNDFAGFSDNSSWSFTTDDGTVSFVGECPSFVESFEAEPGTSYTLSDPFDAGFDFFGRFAVPDNDNGARDDFQSGWTGGFGILSQDNDGTGGAATRTITIGPIDVSGASNPVGITGSFGALNSEPAFNNYEASAGDGIKIFATLDGGTRTLIGAFAPNATGASDLYQDTDLDGVGDGLNLTTTLTAYTFLAPSTGTSLVIEIDLTSTDSFEPLAVDNIRVDCEPPVAVAAKIHEVQGSGSTVTNPGNAVTVEGVVVGDYQEADELKGFFLQEEDADTDADPNTSEGIFVFCGSCAVEVTEGQIVQVTGIQGEGSVSQIDVTQFGGNVAISNAGDNSALASPALIDLPASMSTEEETTYENVEGMLVQFIDELTVTEYFQLGRFGQIVLSEGGTLRQFTNDNMPSAGGFTAAQDETARRRIILDDLNNVQNFDPVYHPQPGGFAVDNFIRGGYTVPNLTGVMDFASPGSGDATWRIRPQVDTPVSFRADNPRTEAPESVGGTLKVASFNVLNYFTTIDENGQGCGQDGSEECRGADSQAELLRQTEKIVAALKAIDADVVGLIELENNPAAAPAGDGVDPVLENLVNALNAEMGAGTYDFVDAGVVGTDVIKVAFIYKPATVSLVGAAAILDSQAFVDPNNIGPKNRAALAQTFQEIATGESFTTVVNHLKSKGSGCGAGDDDTTTGQGNCNDTRTKAAIELANWLATNPTGSTDPDALIIGDLNAYALEDPIKALTSNGYTDLVNQFVGEDAYSFVFDGQFGYLDHALANGDMFDQITGTTIWHINSDEVNLLDYNDTVEDPGEEFFEAKPLSTLLYANDPYRSSDHDPVIVGLKLGSEPICEVTNLALNKPTQNVCDYGNSSSDLGVDGILNGSTPWGSNPDIVHTCNGIQQPWWEVDLGEGVESAFEISEVCIYNRSSDQSSLVNRLKNYYIFISCTPFDKNANVEDLLADPNIYSKFMEEPPQYPTCIDIPDVVGQYVRIQLLGSEPLHFAELEVYGCPTEADCGPVVDPCDLLAQPEIEPAGPFLPTDTPQQLEASPEGGTWGGPVSATGVFDPSIGAGTYEITYTIQEGECIKMATTTIEVLDPTGCVDPANLALEGSASQSSTYGKGDASLAIDGNTTGDNPWSADLQHTTNEAMPWWQVDLGQQADIKGIRIYNRTSTSQYLLDRLRNFWVFVSTEPLSGDLQTNLNNPQVLKYFMTETGTVLDVPLTGIGQYVQVQLGEAGILHMAEVEVNGCPVESGIPVASFTATPSSGDAPLPVNFDASTSSDLDGTIVDYAWNFGDGNVGSGVNSSNTYTTPGTYTVTLVVTDNEGNSASTTQTITVIDPTDPGCTNPTNLALNGIASQSSTYGNGFASFANDGNTFGDSPWTADLQHTDNGEAEPWWQVDLGTSAEVKNVQNL